MPSISYDQTSQTHSHQQAKLWAADASKECPPPLTGERLAVRQNLDADLGFFLWTLFPEAFPLEPSPSHLRMISEIQKSVDHGGLKAIAAPRGSGKTSIMLRAALWAMLSGRRRYVCLVAADADSAISNLATVKAEINHNERIAKYYRRETWCVRQLGGEPRRAATQHYEGRQTGVEYSRNGLCLGTIPDCPISGARISTAGITGRIRGQQALTLDGEILRPDFVLVDDPSTKLSAASTSQNKKRHETMMGDILGLAGPGVKIAGFCTCTVIYQDDLADRILDRKLSADWNGDRIAMVKSWPTWMDGWDQYNQMRVDELLQERDHEGSRQFVRDNFDRLHEGAEVYWEARKSEHDVSALQHAMDLYFRDTGVFAAEYQNAPLDQVATSPYDIQTEAIMRRITGIPRGAVPEDVDKITAFIDTQRELLYYVVVAWSITGRGYVIDYGACPDQKRHHWAKHSVPYTLSQIYGDDFETYLRSGLDWLIGAILENEYTTENGAKVMVDRLAIDARWGESTAIIRKLARESRHRARLHPSMGMFVGANSKPWQQLKSSKERRSDRRGVHAKLVTPKDGGRRELLYDSNYWKSFCADRLLCHEGSPKAIMLFDAEPHKHRMFAEHCAVEEPVRVLGKANNEVVEWRTSSSQVENDFWDCLVGNAALASTIGVETHSGNRKGGQGMSRAIESVLKRKPSTQFFQTRG